MSGRAFARRSFLAGTLGATGLGAASILTGCSTVTPSSDLAALNKPVPLPSYIPFNGPKPDLPAIGKGYPDAFYGYPKTIDTKTTTLGDGSTVRGSVPTSSPVPPSVSTNEYWQELNKRLNIDLKLTITPAGDYAQKFQTAVAGGTLGSMWNINAQPPYLAQLLQAKAADLTEFLSGDAIREYPFLANVPTASWEGCVFNGGIYAVPIPRGILGTGTLLTRADLFEERGVDATFRNFDELLAMAKEMTDKRKNRWAFANVPNSILGTMLGLPNNWEEREGKFTNEQEFEGHKELLSRSRQLIAKGLVHPDSISAYNGKVWFNQGSAAMVQDSFTAIPGYYQQNVAGPGFKLGFPTIPGPDGTPGGRWLGDPNNSLGAIAKGSKRNTRMLLRILDWMAAPLGTDAFTFRKYGIEGRDFTFEKGEPILTPTGNSEAALGAFPIQYLADSPIPIYYAGHPEGTDAVYASLKEIRPTAKTNVAYGLYAPTNSIKGRILSQITGNGTNDVLLGRQPVSSWNQVMKDWRASGGDEIRDQYEKAFAIHNS